jgi:urease accessory protein
MSGALADGLALVLQPTNLLALAALGLLAGRQGRRECIASGFLFALGLLIGALAIAAALREPPVAIALLAIGAIVGVVVAAGWQPPLPVTAAFTLAGGGALALNAPPQAITLGAAMASQLASGLGALVAFALVMLLAAAARQPWQRIAVRIIASWIAASAILALALRLAR